MLNVTHSPARPNWFYHYIEINNLEDIQNEFLQAFPLVLNNNQKGKNWSGPPPESVEKEFGWSIDIAFYQAKKKEIVDILPLFSQYLKTVNLYNRWQCTAFHTIPGGKNSPTHFDSLDTVNRNQALNIPVLNCKNTFTKWYKSNPVQPCYYSYDGGDTSMNTAYFCDPFSAEELCSIESNKPILMNVSIPHNAINPNSTMRFLVSTRFSPELDDSDLKHLGIKYPYLQS